MSDASSDFSLYYPPFDIHGSDTANYYPNSLPYPPSDTRRGRNLVEAVLLPILPLDLGINVWKPW